MEIRVQPKLVAVVLALTLAGCGGGTPAPTPVPTPPPSPGFQLLLENVSLQAPSGCVSTVLTVSAAQGFSGTVSLDCTDQPAGLRCGFGSQPSFSSGGSARVGVTLNADANVPNGTYGFQVRGRSGPNERTVPVQASLSHSLVAPTSSAVMAVTGCAGYVDGLPDPASLQSYLSTFVGAWKNNYRGTFCVQTLGSPDGWFVLYVPAACFLDGERIYLTSGGLDACVVMPFRAGGMAHVDLLGRMTPCP